MFKPTQYLLTIIKYRAICLSVQRIETSSNLIYNCPQNFQKSKPSTYRFLGFVNKRHPEFDCGESDEIEIEIRGIAAAKSTPDRILSMSNSRSMRLPQRYFSRPSAIGAFATKLHCCHCCQCGDAIDPRRRSRHGARHAQSHQRVFNTIHQLRTFGEIIAEASALPYLEEMETIAPALIKQLALGEIGCVTFYE